MHQKILDWGHALLAFAIGLIALIGVLLFAWHVEEATPWASMGPGDWGVWVGAVGTVATLVGTIVLATSSERTKRNEERDRAFVAASGLLLQMHKVREVLEFAAEHFSDISHEVLRVRYATQARLIEEADTWTELKSCL